MQWIPRRPFRFGPVAAWSRNSPASMTMAEAKFIETFASQGFDGSLSANPWQFVPLGGARLVAISAPAGDKLHVNGKNVADAFEVYAQAPANASHAVRGWSASVNLALNGNPALGGCRFFAVRGIAPGQAKVFIGLKWINIDVAGPSIVPVYSHFCSDADGGYASVRDEGHAAKVIAEANRILEPQTGIKFMAIGSQRLAAPKKLGQSIKHALDKNDQPKSSDESHLLTDQRFTEAVNYFFVWKVSSTAQSDTTPDAVAIGDRCALVTDAVDGGVGGGAALVHEFIHCCGFHGHDPDTKSIMTKFRSKTPSTAIRHPHLEAIRTWANQPW